INRRIKELGGEALRRAPSATDASLVVLVPWDHEAARPFLEALERSPGALGEQGYLIRFHRVGPRVLALALGADALGTLYAAETLARLIQPGSGDGGPALLEATVTDWPAFKRRCIGLIGSGTGRAPGA